MHKSTHRKIVQLGQHNIRVLQYRVLNVQALISRTYALPLEMTSPCLTYILSRREKEQNNFILVLDWTLAIYTSFVKSNLRPSPFTLYYSN